MEVEMRRHERMNRCLFFFLPGQFPCGSTADPTGSTGDDSDAASVYDGVVFALDRGDEGFDAEGGRRGPQRRWATVSTISHRHVQKIKIKFVQKGERRTKGEVECGGREDGEEKGRCESIYRVSWLE